MGIESGFGNIDSNVGVVLDFRFVLCSHGLLVFLVTPPCKYEIALRLWQLFELNRKVPSGFLLWGDMKVYSVKERGEVPKARKTIFPIPVHGQEWESPC